MYKLWQLTHKLNKVFNPIIIIIIVKKKRRIAIHHPTSQGDVIIIIRRNGAKTISFQTLFGRFN